MSVSNVKIPYGREFIEFSIPDDNLIGVYSPQDFPAVADLKNEILQAINNPIGTKPVRELARGAKKVVLVADDNTRLTPTRQNHSGPAG